MSDKVSNESGDKSVEPEISTSITLSSDPKKDAKEAKKQPSTSAQKSSTSANNNSRTKAAPPLKKANNTLAIIAIVIAIVTIFLGAVGGYWLYQQQNITQEQMNKSFSEQQRGIEQQLTKNNNAITKQLANATTKNSQMTQQSVARINTQLSQLSQNKPSEWLLHEAQYLIRIALRSLWLEKNTPAAINLLQDADNRISQLNDPSFLPVRKAINQDIATLKLLPQRESEAVIIKLMALNEQVNKLPLSMAYIPQTEVPEAPFELSNNIDDWRANLAKTWKKFQENFITISRRTGNVEPLMSPQYQQNLRQNLQLKIQLAQWAVTEQNEALYQTTLADIQTWLHQYFDMSHVTNQNFEDSLKPLNTQVIAFKGPKSLLALSAIEQAMKPKTSLPTLNKTKENAKQGTKKNTKSLTELLLIPEKKPIENKPTDENTDEKNASPNTVKPNTEIEDA